jgi:signal transduction histidine kinase
VPFHKTANNALQMPSKEASPRAGHAVVGDLRRHLPAGQQSSALAKASSQDEIISVYSFGTQPREKKSRLEKARYDLELLVSERTAELRATILSMESQAIENRQMEKSLRRSQQELQRSSYRTLLALEADRQWISKELHDSIGASLAAIKLGLEESIQQEEMARNGSSMLKQIVGTLVEMIKETKRVAAHLRPLTLDDLGLISTIEAYCREFSERYSSIKTEITVKLKESDIHADQKIVLYRVLQEAMSRAACHDNPRVIRIVLVRKADMIEFWFEDAGRGFESASPPFDGEPVNGHGIESMRERVTISGGVFETDSIMGLGTRLRVALPFIKAGEHDPLDVLPGLKP